MMVLNRSPSTFSVGTRGSRLAVVQTRNALDRLAKQLPGCRFEDVVVSSPGDRDLDTDLRETPADFFTRDLDEKILAGELDCAVHSAKDVPDPVCDGIDWFWLPWREDPRDAVILPPGRSIEQLPAESIIGVSSERREAYCRRRFPSAQLRNIRGNIEERLSQLDAGDFGAVLMAAAALIRLDLPDRISELIPLDELPPPDGQGYLAVTFRSRDERFLRMRSLFVKAVVFAAGGVGSGGTCTLDTLKALQRCDVCLHDTLMGPDLLERLPATVQRIPVGKRCGQHSLPQEETTALIARHARRGRRVVRLKGGDPGIFGRLAEEVEALDALGLPYHALPGVTSLTAASTGTGILLTRRGLSRGFCTMTPRLAGGELGPVSASERIKLPIVFYMSVSAADTVTRKLIEDGLPADTSAAVVFGAGGDQAYVISGTLSDIGKKVAQGSHELPGTLIVGEVVQYRYPTEWGALQGRRTLLTCSRALQDRAAGLVLDFGGVPVRRPLIRLAPSPEGLSHVRNVGRYDWVVLTSPSAVRCFAELLRLSTVDIRSVPKLASCGGGTSEELTRMGFTVDVEPETDFGGNGLLAAVKPLVTHQTRILRLRSDKAGPGLAEALRKLGATVADCVLYHNERIDYDAKPDFDVVFFASASAVEGFDAQWGLDTVSGKSVAAIGQPTLAALEKRGVPVDLVAPEATVESSITALAEQCVRQALTLDMESKP